RLPPVLARCANGRRTGAASRTSNEAESTPGRGWEGRARLVTRRLNYCRCKAASPAGGRKDRGARAGPGAAHSPAPARPAPASGPDEQVDGAAVALVEADPAVQLAGRAVAAVDAQRDGGGAGRLRLAQGVQEHLAPEAVPPGRRHDAHVDDLV